MYLLILEAHGPLEVGRLGTLVFEGWYIYVGSALGPGGLKRLERHFDYRGRLNAPVRWHVDALLAVAALRGAVVGVTYERLECLLVDGLGATLLPAFKGFGSSDCGCETHLFSATSYKAGRDAAWQALGSLGLWPQEVI